MTENEKGALFGVQAFSGNNYNSAFFMEWKAMWWKYMSKEQKFIQLFADFASTFFDQAIDVKSSGGICLSFLWIWMRLSKLR